MKTITRAALAALALALGSCDDGEATSRPEMGAMFDSVEAQVWQEGYEAGRWQPDWDDAPFYGVAFYSRAGFDWDVPEYRERALEAVDYDLEVIEAGLADPGGTLVEQVSAVTYGTLGVIEYMAASGDMEPLGTVDEAIDMVDGMLALLGDYASGFDNYAINTYGPTSITAVFTMVHLQYALLLETDRRDERIARAEELVARIDELAWNGGFYQYAPDRPDDLYLYPNVAMMIAHGRLYQVTGEGAHLERARAIYDAIQALRCPDRPGYRSPYSAEVMGAETDDYSTLSSQNYAILAFAILAEATAEQVFRDEVDELLGFIEDYLWVPGDGKVYHHWMDGRLAVATDPEYYCIGCNLQLLYIMWWIDEHLG